MYFVIPTFYKMESHIYIILWLASLAAALSLQMLIGFEILMHVAIMH